MTGQVSGRREAEAFIRAGRVRVNNQVAHIGQRMGVSDHIRLDGKRIVCPETRTLVPLVGLYHKPVGELCSKKVEDGQASVFQRLPKCPIGRWIMVGRLDLNTSGLLLFTNSGDLANRLMHPSSDLMRVYKVRVLGAFEPRLLEAMQKGVRLEDGWAQFEYIKRIGAPKETGANQWFEVGLKEGRNRLVRRLFEHFDLTVNRLIRIRFGPYRLERNHLPGMFKRL